MIIHCLLIAPTVTCLQMAEIQRLMGSLLYADRLADSPYKVKLPARSARRTSPAID